MKYQRLIIMAGLVTCLLVSMALPGAAQSQHPPAEEVDLSEIDEIDDDVWDDIGNRHSMSVTTHSVDYVGDYAVISMSSRTGEESVVVTDSTLEETGEMPRYSYKLQAGQNTFRVPLENPENKAVVIDSEGSAYLHIGESELPLNLTPDLLPYVAVGLGLILCVVMLVGLELFARLNGGNTKVVR